MPGKPICFSVQKARQAQKQLCKKLVLEDRLPSTLRFVAGLDTAYRNSLAICAAAVLDYATLKLVEVETAHRPISFPYVPTLLSFREVPPAMSCIGKVRTDPDVFLVDGQGYAHPYRCGFASHLGLVLKKPTIGVAKSRLIGEPMDKISRDGARLLFDRGEVVGAEVQTQINSKPVYVSIGHLVSLSRAIDIVKHCAKDNRIPEPLRIAHDAANEEKRKLDDCRAVFRGLP